MSSRRSCRLSVALAAALLGGVFSPVVRSTPIDAQEQTTEVYAIGSGRRITVYASTGERVVSRGGRYRGTAYAGWRRFTYRVYVPQLVGDPCYVVRSVLRPPDFVVPPPPPFSPGLPCPPEAVDPTTRLRQQVVDELASGFATLDIEIPAPLTARPAQAVVGLPVSFSVNAAPTSQQTLTVAGVGVTISLTSTLALSVGDLDQPTSAVTTPLTPRLGGPAEATTRFDFAGPPSDPNRGSVDVWVTQSWSGTWAAPAVGIAGIFTDELVAVNDVDLADFGVNQLRAVLQPTTP